MTKTAFQKLVYTYYKKYGRHDLPWRKTTDPYKIMVSEIMLQQTQVDRVKEKYKAFIKQFPTSKSLHEASLGDVLKLWQGLGYNRRAINLKKAASAIVQNYKGKMPEEYVLLLELPGIGPYTASAIRAFSFIEKMQDEKKPREWYWALMDYGSFIKKEFGNANKVSRHYTKQSKFEGSDRQVRGEILKFLIAQDKPVKKQDIISAITRPKEKIKQKIKELKQEGFISENKGFFVVSSDV